MQKGRNCKMGRTVIGEVQRDEESMMDRQKLIPWWEQDVVNNSYVLVIGAGAIGNEVLKNLALIGIGHIFICDMDVISTSNLSRTVLFGKKDVGKYKAEIAAQRVREMSVCPDVEVDYFIGDIMHLLGNGVFRQFDVVIGCLDNYEARTSVNKRCNLLKIPYVDGGIRELGMSVSVFHYPQSSCWACSVSKKQLANEKMIRYSCDEKRKRFVEEKKAPTIQISTAVAGALAVQEAVKILHGMGQTQYGMKYYFEGLTNSFESIRIPRRDNCMYHNSYDKVETTHWTNQAVLGEFLEWVKEQNDGEEFYIDITGEHRFTFTGRCKTCGSTIDFHKPDYLIYAEDYYCSDCIAKKDFQKGLSSSDEIVELRASDERISHMTLEELGIAKGHIVTVRSCSEDSKCRYYELTADLPDVLGSLTVRESLIKNASEQQRMIER